MAGRDEDYCSGGSNQLISFFTLALRNLSAHKTRSILTLVGISTSVAIFFSIVSFNRGFETGLFRELERTGIHFMVVPSGCPHEVASLVLHGAVIPKYLDIDVLEKLKGFEGIELASPLFVAQVPNPSNHRIDLVYGMDMTHVRKLKPGWVINGKIPSTDREVLVGKEIADHDKLEVGSMIHYPEHSMELRVTGIVERTGSQDDAFIYMPIALLQEIINKPDGITAIGARVFDPLQLNEISEKLAAVVPGIQIVTMGQILSSLTNLAASAKTLSLSIASIAVFVSAVGVMNTILMAVFERMQQIGMMRAIGASRFDIFRIIITETLLMTLAGGISGIVLSVVGSQFLENLVRLFMPYVPSGKMIMFEPGLALVCIVFSVVIGIVSGLYPAWKASKIHPIEAIKG